MSAIANFLAADGVDHAGRSHADILAKDDAWLERTHDYIQWLFPLEVPSGSVFGAPVLTPDDIAALRPSPICRQRMQAAAARMDAFYRDTAHWLRPYDHNHLRITRIIHSTRLLVSDEAADAFREEVLAQVERAGARIDPKALAHWRAA